MKAGIYNRKTLTDLFLTVIKDFPKKGIGFVQPDGSINFMTYSELLSLSKSMMAGMQSLGMDPGDKTMIVMTKNEEIIPILWSCFLSGYIPTILQPPLSFSEFNQPAQKIENVYKTLGNPKVILSADLLKGFQSEVISSENLVTTEDLKSDSPVPDLYHPKESDIAFIQFSSGSTGDPKGIMLTHKNILTNLAAIGVGLDVYDTDVFTNWMPLYHDMGLFGYHLCPIFGQTDQYLIDPIDFVKKPSLWPEIMDKARCTITGCPNFGQALLLRYLKNREDRDWDLSTVKGIVNGAEPISSRIMNDFLDRLAPNSLRRGAMMPAYGMSEATLAISFSELLKPPVVIAFNRTKLQIEGLAVPEKENIAEMIELVSVGKALDNTEIRVVDDSGGVLGDNTDGNIQIRGAGVTAGYYNNPVETSRSFDNGWLKTGDKGFFFEGNLYITGRVKDIIFVRGQNLYAHDLEELAGKYSDISYGKVIIGGWFDPKKGQDQIILFLVGSVNQATSGTCVGLRNFFRDTYGISIDVFIPLRSNQVPKTSSGKIQRFRLITSFQNGEFNDVIAALRKLIKESEQSA
jgi:acyl-CoA synthetase (AMP-forming)/AMP-acid ligase II